MSQFKKREIKNTKGAMRALKEKKYDDDNDESDEVDIVIASKKKLSEPNFQSSTKKDTGNKATTSSVTTIYESLRDVAPQSYAGDATHTSEIDTATDRDARAVLERNIKMNEDFADQDISGAYKGQAGYKNFIKKDIAQVGSNKYTGTQGPIRAPAFVRSSTRFDYAPDVCKDYKETGFCGYGDQCKFLHDRGDYKTGWQLEKEWDVEQSRKKKKLEEMLAKCVDGEGADGLGEGVVDAEEDDEQYVVDDVGDELPFACMICRESFTDPVVTLCQHYFCRNCALEHQRKSKRCAACEKLTNGVFNTAFKLVKRLKLTSKAREGESVLSISRGTWESV